jgi:hypothetical protein
MAESVCFRSSSLGDCRTHPPTAPPTSPPTHNPNTPTPITTPPPTHPPTHPPPKHPNTHPTPQVKLGSRRRLGAGSIHGDAAREDRALVPRPAPNRVFESIRVVPAYENGLRCRLSRPLRSILSLASSQHTLFSHPLQPPSSATLQFPSRPATPPSPLTVPGRATRAGAADSESVRVANPIWPVSSIGIGR